jgi:transposase-like protein
MSNRCVVTYALLLAAGARRHKRGGGVSWWLEETYIKVSGQWKYLYRAVDKAGDTIDFLLTAKRDTKAALRFLRQAIDNNGTPDKINLDKSGANTAAIQAYDAETGSTIEIRQCKYLNNILELDHRPGKQKTRSALGFRAFYLAHAALQGNGTVQDYPHGTSAARWQRQPHRPDQQPGSVATDAAPIVGSAEASSRTRVCNRTCKGIKHDSETIYPSFQTISRTWSFRVVF